MPRKTAPQHFYSLKQSRWLIAFCAVAMQMMLGTAYAWSVFKNPLAKLHHWSSGELSVAFALMIFFLGVSAAFGGKFVDKAGARKVATCAAILFGLGTLLTGYATQIGNLYLLWLSYGVIAGIGNGLGYITPVAVLVRWFPDRRGFITGIAVMGFGFGGAFISLLAPILIGAFGITQTFYVLGMIYLLVMFLCAQTFHNPPARWLEFVCPALQKKHNKSQALLFSHNVTLATALRMPQFYIMWFVFFVNITAGVALLSNLSPLVQNNFHVTAYTAGILVFFTSVFNGLGRVFWSTLSDKIGRQTTFRIIIYSQIPALFLLPIVHNVYLFGLVSCYIVACMGGGFATMPAFAADIFGSKNMGNIYGKFLLAWSTAGVIGPILVEGSKSLWNDYNMMFYILGLVFVCIYIPLSYFLKPVDISKLTDVKPTPPKKHVHRKNAFSVGAVTKQVKEKIALRLTQYNTALQA